MTTSIGTGIATRSIGPDLVEHKISTSRYIDVKEINKYILAADMGLFEIPAEKPMLERASLESDAARAVEVAAVQAALAEGEDVIRFKERDAVALHDHAADGLGGADCGPVLGGDGPVGGGAVVGGGTCPGMGPDLLDAAVVIENGFMPDMPL